jgi:hypothetical protein
VCRGIARHPRGASRRPSGLALARPHAVDTCRPHSVGEVAESRFASPLGWVAASLQNAPVSLIGVVGPLGRSGSRPPGGYRRQLGQSPERHHPQNPFGVHRADGDLKVDLARRGRMSPMGMADRVTVAGRRPWLS